MLTQPTRRKGRPRKPATRPQASKPAKPVADPYGEQTTAGRVLSRCAPARSNAPACASAWAALPTTQ